MNKKNISQEEVFKLVWSQVAEIYSRWKVYLQVFSEETSELRQNVAPTFFSICEYAFLESIFVKIRAVLDKPYYDKKQTIPNACITLLIDKISCSVSQHSLFLEKLEEVKRLFESVKKVVDKAIAHYDYSIHTTDEFIAVNRVEFEKGLTHVNELVNDLEDLSGRGRTEFKEPILQGDGNSLIAALRIVSVRNRRIWKGLIPYFSPNDNNIDQKLYEMTALKWEHPKTIILKNNLTKREIQDVLCELFGLIIEESEGE